MPRRDRNDPVRKIFAANKSVQKKKYAYNERLLRILERLEYDRPILMRDKLDVIWEKAPQKINENETPLTSITYEDSQEDGNNETSTRVKASQKNLMTNEHDVKRKLERKKLERSLINKRQIEVYHKLLDHLNHRFKPIPG